MTESTFQSSTDLGQAAVGNSDPSSPHAPSSSHLHPSTHDSASDNEASERPVREKLKKASIQFMPKGNATPRISDPPVEDSSDVHPGSPLPGDSPLDRTPSPSAESRGRLSRKRSYDDSIDTAATAGDLSKNIRIPGKKRSGEELDTDSHREQKIAATEGARAQRRSEDSERNQAPYRGDETGPLGNTVQQEHQANDKNEQTSNQVASSTGESESSQGGPSLLHPAKKLQADEAAQKATSKLPGGFAASGFAAMSSSTASPFGNLGASTSSVFRSTHTNHNAAGTANGRPNGFNFAQISTQTASDTSASPFLSNAAATSASPFAAANGAVKSTGFGSSAFGSGFANSAMGGPKLKSFAAPTGDLAPPKKTESSNAFGTQADPSGDNEEDGSAGEATNEEVGVDTDEVDSRFQQQEVETGESGEVSIFIAPRAQLYHYYESGWHEKGKGAFKLNVSDDKTKEKKARFIMRAHQTYRLLLNQPLFKQMQVGDQGKRFSFAVIDEGKAVPHLLK
ncbi:MAG: hypothetical protein LQ352_006268, partial [Teloschistes flavicans]